MNNLRVNSPSMIRAGIGLGGWGVPGAGGGGQRPRRSKSLPSLTPTDEHINDNIINV